MVIGETGLVELAATGVEAVTTAGGGAVEVVQSPHAPVTVERVTGEAGMVLVEFVQSTQT